MLMALTAELGRLELLPVTDRSPHDLSVQVDQCVAYAVSLCDALALIGNPSAIGLLHATMELKHRRLRCEAAAALAALGDEHGKATLLAMAADPASRLRVVAYAKELGLTQRVAPEYRRPDALAAAELALFLAQPTQIGIPPAACELVDRRELFWPGFEEPVECFLLRYTYRLGDREFSNIGIVGPLTHALAADLQDLPVDDIYACFAGWQAEHEEIVEHDVSRLAPAQRVEVDRLQRKAHDRGFDSIQPLKLARFFGEKVLVATANREGHPGVIVVDQSDVHWYHATATSRPYGPVEAYNIFKGRRLLRSFNE
jgi:hypothetical protein